MKNNIFCLIFILCVGCSFKKADINEIVILDNPIMDIGNIKQGVIIDTFFVISNISDDLPIRIDAIQTDCYCTTTYADSPSIIESKKTKAFRFKFDANNLGVFQNKMLVSTSIGNQRLIQIVRGKVVSF